VPVYGLMECDALYCWINAFELVELLSEDKMMQRSKYLRARLPVVLIGAAIAALGSTGADAASRADADPVQAELRSTAVPHEALMARELVAPTPTAIRVAEQYKYEIPKVDRAAPAPQAAIPRALPGPSLRSAPSRRARQGGRSRSAPVSYGGSCEGCRNACYNGLHGTPQFVPCMRSCFNRLCRR
jgi:hypothetical protein